MLDTVEVWAIALTDLKITRNELFTAQRKSMSLEWPPTAPADFLALSRIDAMSEYPGVNEAYKCAANRKYKKHEVIYETARRVGFWELKTKPEHISYKAWVKEYPIVCSEHRLGASFTLPDTHRIAQKPHEAVKQGTDTSRRIDEQLAAILKPLRNN